jgi:hypothetical protein
MKSTHLLGCDAEKSGREVHRRSAFRLLLLVGLLFDPEN